MIDSLNITEALLSKNQFSRPGKPLDCVKAIVVHYLGNPGQGPHGARDYWESLKTQDAADKRPDISASAHYIVGFEGEILRTIPETEKAYHCGALSFTDAALEFFGDYCTDPNSSPNRVTIGVEFCHFEASGKPGAKTRASLLGLVQCLCQRYELNPLFHVWRHWDVTGKTCPKWFVDNSDEWSRFILDLTARPIGE
jgi:N-acetylmuramoyl-L-alanine amidase